MEAFNLLKYWKGGASQTQNDIKTDPDDGPFFDLELALTDDDDDDDSEDDANDNQNDNENEHNNNDSESESESEKELKLRVCPSISSEEDHSLSVSSSEDLIIKGNLILTNTNSSDSKPQLTATLLKSATKFRVFMLGLKKPKPNSPSNNTHSTATTTPKPKQRKPFTLKFKVEEVPIVSLFTRDNNTSKPKPSQEESQPQPHSPSSASDEKRFMRNYFKMVKPLYVRVSRRYADKILTSPESGKASTPVKEKVPTEVDDDSESDGTVNSVKPHKQGNVVPLPAALLKHLGKARSAPPLQSSNRRDDSLLQQHDWIQGAILHCKNSFNASTECESSQLPQSVSDQLGEITPELSEKSNNDKCL